MGLSTFWTCCSVPAQGKKILIPVREGTHVYRPSARSDLWAKGWAQRCGKIQSGIRILVLSLNFPTEEACSLSASWVQNDTGQRKKDQYIDSFVWAVWHVCEIYGELWEDMPHSESERQRCSTFQFWLQPDKAKQVDSWETAAALIALKPRTHADFCKCLEVFRAPQRPRSGMVGLIMNLCSSFVALFVFCRNFSRRCQANAVLGQQIYFPIIFSQYDPKVVYSGKVPSNNHFAFTQKTGPRRKLWSCITCVPQGRSKSVVTLMFLSRLRA